MNYFLSVNHISQVQKCHATYPMARLSSCLSFSSLHHSEMVFTSGRLPLSTSSINDLRTMLSISPPERLYRRASHPMQLVVLHRDFHRIADRIFPKGQFLICVLAA